MARSSHSHKALLWFLVGYVVAGYVVSPQSVVARVKGVTSKKS